MIDLTKRLRALDHLRASLLDEVSALDPAHLTAGPVPGRWSFLEVAEHLAFAEREVMNGVSDASRLPAWNRTLANRLGFFLVRLILRFPVPVLSHPISGPMPVRQAVGR